MKNLVIRRQRRRSIQFIKDIVKDNRQFLELQCTVNTNNNDLYVLLGNELYMLPIDHKRNINNLTITKYENCKIVGLEYSILTEELYCAYDSGDIARIDVTNESHFEYEIIAKFDDLECVKLSPDHAIITAVTSTGTVITMVSDFQVISEVMLLNFK